MPQSDRNSQKENKSRGGDPNFNWRGVILFAIAFALIGLAVLFRGSTYANVEDVPYNRFIELLENKQIVTDKNYHLELVVEEGRPTQTLRPTFAPVSVLPLRCRFHFGPRFISITTPTYRSGSQPRAFSPRSGLNQTFSLRQ